MPEPGVGIGLLGGLGTALQNWGKNRQDADASAAASQSAWEDFVKKASYEKDLQTSMEDASSKRRLGEQEALYDYEQKNKNQQDAVHNAFGELADDPDFGPIAKKAALHDPQNPLTPGEQLQYNAVRNAYGYLSNGQPLDSGSLDQVNKAGLPVGVQAKILGTHAAMTDNKKAHDAALAEMQARTGLTQNQAGEVLNKPYELGVKADAESGKARATRTAKINALNAGYDKEVESQEQQIAANQDEFGRIKPNTPNIDAVRAGVNAKINAHAGRIIDLKGDKASLNNSMMSEYGGEAAAHGNQPLQDMIASLTANQGPLKKTAKFFQDQSIPAPGPRSAPAGDYQDEERSGPAMVFGKDPAKIPEYNGNPKTLKHNGVYKFAAGYGRWNAKTKKVDLIPSGAMKPGGSGL